MAAVPPVLPDDAKALIPSANASFCEKFVALPARLAIAFYNLIKWAINDDGTATDELKAWLGLTPSSDIAVPTGLSATDGTDPDKVVVTWTASVAATSYTIYRGVTPDSAAATVLGTSTTTSYNDEDVTPGDVWNYWVKAITAAGTSGFSNGDTGYASTGSGGGGSFTTQSSSITFTATFTGTHTFKAWAGGGGGRGGVLYTGGNPAVPYFTAGKGGGSSGYSEVTISLTAGDEVNIYVGAGGAVNGDGQVTTATLVSGGGLVIRAEAGNDQGVAGAAWDTGTYPPDGSVTVSTNLAGVAGSSGGTCSMGGDAAAGAGADAPSNGSSTYGNGGNGGGMTAGDLSPSAQLGYTGAVTITW